MLSRSHGFHANLALGKPNCRTVSWQCQAVDQLGPQANGTRFLEYRLSHDPSLFRVNQDRKHDPGAAPFHGHGGQGDIQRANLKQPIYHDFINLRIQVIDIRFKLDDLITFHVFRWRRCGRQDTQRIDPSIWVCASSPIANCMSVKRRQRLKILSQCLQ